MNNGKSIAQRYRDTLVKEKRLTKLGYIVYKKWSCDFARDKKQEPIREFVNSLNIQDPINVRDCYFGGRTNGIILHKIFKNGEKGHYVDFTSLYPDVLKYRKFPVGHPTRITKNFDQPYWKKCDGNCFYDFCQGHHMRLPYFGIMKATFVPPTNLIHPILPLKCNGKLKFLLCYKCACLQQEICICSDEQRSFTHTYCTPEIEVAMNMGYKILQVHEVLHWQKSEVYDPVNKEGGLFTGYSNTFLKLKQ